MSTSGTRPHTPAQLVRLVAGREVSTRIRDKGFLLGSGVLIVLILGMLVFQVAINSGGESTRLAVVGGSAAVTDALEAQGEALDTDVSVVDYDDEAAARRAVEDGDVDAALLSPSAAQPELLVENDGGTAETIVQGAVQGMAVSQQLADAGVQLQSPPEVDVVALDPDADADTEAAVVALVGVVVLYSLLILFGQFVAQGVVEEKSSRVVELLLATMRPWQLLAGKILGLGLLGLGQMLVIAVIGVAGALAFDVVELPGRLIGTVVTVVAWFVLGYAFYASVFAAAASLVSRQEDLGSVITPASLLLVVGFVVSIQAAQEPTGTLATVTSFVPGLSPLVMPVRQAAGGAAWWEVVVAVVLMLVSIAAIVRVGGRVYSGALLRTGGKVKLREALSAERA
ncbi:ABC-type Na+ efflux pump, permease component [Modestobacter italicus]|uniref:ABC-type Na+ efflux pump, permease component n=1 Tax=Modestobacter italicus (strain DSM 44449 / CECT 9708 / BC 501) TaxID=2732864 RepID=I4ESH3_MODI5|nr:ABC transporter permease [Modestobacter marinus]CCH86336.1 ABC-type Na+ efflux pump, permease component [Modestobacter marinus]